MRSEYKNGDPVHLSCGCNSCNPVRIDGVFCHETGCPDAWRDYERECFECGCEFLREDKFQQTCSDCRELLC